ncbi:MAG: hypothetical protein FD143_2791 [Ignavibacteria bacterium]|nr:MAG: hypothetical protein FD143_2791 [Ignavibacteria bacterium]KAF0158302.1 MAG: hypothetical protein FD188_2560 [Ignavibacteria bacterium]
MRNITSFKYNLLLPIFFVGYLLLIYNDHLHGCTISATSNYFQDDVMEERIKEKLIGKSSLLFRPLIKHTLNKKDYLLIYIPYNSCGACTETILSISAKYDKEKIFLVIQKSHDQIVSSLIKYYKMKANSFIVSNDVFPSIINENLDHKNPLVIVIKNNKIIKVLFLENNIDVELNKVYSEIK